MRPRRRRPRGPQSPEAGAAPEEQTGGVPMFQQPPPGDGGEGTAADGGAPNETNPAGNGTLGNEWILGAAAKVTF